LRNTRLGLRKKRRIPGEKSLNNTRERGKRKKKNDQRPKKPHLAIPGETVGECRARKPIFQALFTVNTRRIFIRREERNQEKQNQKVEAADQKAFLQDHRRRGVEMIKTNCFLTSSAQSQERRKKKTLNWECGVGPGEDNVNS